MPDDSKRFMIEAPDADTSDLTELQGEIWILLPGAQLLTSFLILLPFNGGFDVVGRAGKPVYIVTFVCALLSLVLFTAPAAHHAVHRPLLDRKDYKALSNRFMVAGLIPFAIASILVAHLIFSQVTPVSWMAWAGTAVTVTLVGGLWWLFPARRRVLTARDSR